MFHMQERQLSLSLFKNLYIMTLGVFLVVGFIDV